MRKKGGNRTKQISPSQLGPGKRALGLAWSIPAGHLILSFSEELPRAAGRLLCLFFYAEARALWQACYSPWASESEELNCRSISVSLPSQAGTYVHRHCSCSFRRNRLDVSAANVFGDFWGGLQLDGDLYMRNFRSRRIALAASAQTSSGALCYALRAGAAIQWCFNAQPSGARKPKPRTSTNSTTFYDSTTKACSKRFGGLHESFS